MPLDDLRFDDYGRDGDTIVLPASLVLTDPPEDWCGLVDQIATLEEMLAEITGSGDRDALAGLPALERLLGERRRQLRHIDVG